MSTSFKPSSRPRTGTGSTPAIRIAVARGWLRADGDPPSSVTLTVDGIKLITPVPAGAKPK
jgi:hypothetical protein